MRVWIPLKEGSGRLQPGEAVHAAALVGPHPHAYLQAYKLLAKHCRGCMHCSNICNYFMFYLLSIGFSFKLFRRKCISSYQLLKYHEIMEGLHSKLRFASYLLK